MSGYLGLRNPLSWGSITWHHLLMLAASIFAQRKGRSMKVSHEDGACRSCQGNLEIIDADDATMTVECESCGDVYSVEPDAFGDGCMTYYANFRLGQSA